MRSYTGNTQVFLKIFSHIKLRGAYNCQLLLWKDRPSLDTQILFKIQREIRLKYTSHHSNYSFSQAYSITKDSIFENVHVIGFWQLNIAYVKIVFIYDIGWEYTNKWRFYVTTTAFQKFEKVTFKCLTMSIKVLTNKIWIYYNKKEANGTNSLQIFSSERDHNESSIHL